MGYRNLRECVTDLERSGQLIRINTELDPNLEISAVQRRVYQAGGPALLFTQLKGSKFPALGNLFGTIERTRFLFRDTLDAVEALVQLKINPGAALKKPWHFLKAPLAILRARPRSVSKGPLLECETTIDQLPAVKSWPKDGGAFITLPQVYTEDPLNPGFGRSNLGMYRVQFTGNRYSNREIGLHYQIHRGIGVHHTSAVQANAPLRVNVFVGGPPAMTVAAVMPLPENLPELSFAGILGGRRIPMITREGFLPMHAEADFCISGVIHPGKTLPEGPFGDHLGYYSLEHDFPVLEVDRVYHRRDAIWPFTTVGRPPQEDTSFGQFIHELTGNIIPSVLPGIKAVHAVDQAGVHPLLLAIGSERYTPYQSENPPQELLTQANAILGQGQLSLAKYLCILNGSDVPQLSIENISDFFQQLLERVDWKRDLHFQTETTIDTLDYSGAGLNSGSKVVIAGRGFKRRALPQTLPADLRLPPGFSAPRVVIPGILAVQAPPYRAPIRAEDPAPADFCSFYSANDPINQFPLIVLADDSEFLARTVDNFLWAAFTRSNPATDIHGIDSFTHHKHWGAKGALVIDARLKPYLPPALEGDAAVEKKVDALGAIGGPLHGII